MHRAVLFVLLLASLAPTGLPAAEFSATGISLPFFDAHGRLTHRLLAQRGVKNGALQQLERVELVYYSATAPDSIVQKVTAADATWDEQRETLTGRGTITVATEANRLTGEGFDFAFATSLLHIHRKFTMTNRMVVLTSDRATVELIVEQQGDERKVRDVKRCEAIGQLHLVVQPGAPPGFAFEEAWSERAIYDGATQVVTLPEPTRYVVKGEKGRLGEAKTMTFDLKAKPADRK